MKTSYYWKLEKGMEAQGKYFVSISIGCPKESLERMDERPDAYGDNLCPDGDMLRRYKELGGSKQAEAEYTAEYLKKLDRLYDKGWLENYVKRLLAIEKERRVDVVFMCYEGKNKFCHRHILAEYLKEKFGLEVTEL